MDTMRQPEDALPERPMGLRQYRASLLSVFLHTGDQRGRLSELSPDLQPLPLPGAVELIGELPEEYREPARDIAGLKLADAVLVEAKEEFEPELEKLLGMNARTLRQYLGLPVQSGGLEKPLTHGDLRQAFYGKLVRNRETELGEKGGSRADVSSTQSPPSQKASKSSPKPKKGALRRLLGKRGQEEDLSIREMAPKDIQECLDPAAKQPPELLAVSSTDLKSLVTTVDIPSTSNWDFAKLAEALDPRNWSRSSFWRESSQWQLSPATRPLFTPVDKRSQKEPSWHGYLFEHVEWDWNLQRMAAFRNFLEIHYDVDPGAQWLRLKFSLYSCEGSQLFVLKQNRGIDVDCGFQCVQALPNAPNPQKASFRLRTVKHVRFADLLDRRSPNQGPKGAGLLLSVLSPVFVGLWMNDLLDRIERNPP